MLPRPGEAAKEGRSGVGRCRGLACVGKPLHTGRRSLEASDPQKAAPTGVTERLLLEASREQRPSAPRWRVTVMSFGDGDEARIWEALREELRTRELRPKELTVTTILSGPGAVWDALLAGDRCSTA